MAPSSASAREGKRRETGVPKDTNHALPRLDHPPQIGLLSPAPKTAERPWPRKVRNSPECHGRLLNQVCHSGLIEDCSWCSVRFRSFFLCRGHPSTEVRARASGPDGRASARRASRGQANRRAGALAPPREAPTRSRPLFAVVSAAPWVREVATCGLRRCMYSFETRIWPTDRTIPSFTTCRRLPTTTRQEHRATR